MSHSTDSDSSSNYDSVVIGAGPAGCAAATVLADAGRRVLILEREPFPRYRVGESLIPYCWYPLDRLGLVEKLDQSDFIVRKHSVQFVNPQGELSAPFYFHEHYDHDSARTWQVVRDRFDRMLLDNAVAKGAEVWHGAAAKDLLREDGQVVGVSISRDGATQEVRASVTVDASGRDGLAQLRNQWRRADPMLKKVALWGYYRGAHRDGGLDEGATTIAYIPEKGWFWYLPLSGDVVSVGVVADREYLYRDTAVREPAAIFRREVQVQPWIAERVAGAEALPEIHLTGDFTYRSAHCASDGLVLVGDAFSFIDPVFSSGVYFALQSGVMAGDAIDAALAAGDVSAARFKDYGKELCKQIEPMRRLVYAFYDKGFNFSQLFKKYPEKRRDVTDCLIGHLDRDFGDLFRAIGEFATVPDTLEHGAPLESRSREG